MKDPKLEKYGFKKKIYIWKILGKSMKDPFFFEKMEILFKKCMKDLNKKVWKFLFFLKKSMKDPNIFC